MTREERKGKGGGRVAHVCSGLLVCVWTCVCELEGACTVSLNLWWLVNSVISAFKLGVLWSFIIIFCTKMSKLSHRSWNNWNELKSGRGLMFKSKWQARRSVGEQVQGWKREWMAGGKTKKIDSYYRAGCRGRLFSPSSLCGRKTMIGGLGESQTLNPNHNTRQPNTMHLSINDLNLK